MFRQKQKLRPQLLRQCCRCWQLRHSPGLRNFKVTVIGASGAIGQPLSMLLKTHDLVTELVLHDLRLSKGVGADIAHISTKAKVTSTLGHDQLDKAVKCADVVVLAAGFGRKPGMQRSELFDSNADVVHQISCSVSQHCPHALLAIITNPLNSLVPLAAELLKQKDAYDPRRLMGITTLDVVRSETFIADHMNLDPKLVKLPVIGGHAGSTILPVFSQCKPEFVGDQECVKALTKRIQDAGTEVVKAKAGNGSASLSMAFAAARFVNALLLGLKGEQGEPQCAYVESDVTELPFFATPLTFGPKGVEKNLGLPELNEFEKESLDKMLPQLKEEIEKGVKYAKQ